MYDFKILDNINEIIYICDIETYELVYVNRKAREVFGNIFRNGKKLKCYQYLLNKDNVCEFCDHEEFLKEGSNTWFKSHPLNEKHYMFHDSILNMEGRKYRMGLAVDISKVEANAIKIRNSLEVEKRLEECIKNLVTIGNFDDAVNSVLDTILTYYNGDRAYIFDFNLENNICRTTFEFCIKGVKPQIDKLKNIPINIVKAWIELFEKQSIVVIEDINKLEDEKLKEKYEMLMMQDITSLVAVPIFYDGKVQGILGIDNPKNNKRETSFLENLNFFITNEIQKNKLTTSLKNLSYKDMLTGLYNRNAYTEKLKKMNRYSLDSMNKSSFKSKGILFVDMNGLKYLNDTFGHKHGDDMIKHLANVLRRHFNKEDIFRISGDEFLILCKNMTYKEFKDKSENLKKELIVEEKGLACIGYEWDDSNIEMEILEKKAEQYMYAHKQNFYMKNKIYTEMKRPAYVDKIVKMLDKEEYLVYLQPICSIESNAVNGAEALVRRKDKDGSIVTPFEFIHTLEKENLISYIDFFVFEEVCKMLVKWQKQGYPQYLISSNFSRITVAENDFVERVLEICDRTGVNCSQLVFEITESSNVIQIEKLSDIMKTLKSRGIQFALDDMGTEYSTLEMLALEELNAVKLDRSLIMRLKNESRDQYIIESLISLCHKFNMRCIAEGVETKEQYEILANTKCDKIQGYLIGKPMPVEQFEKEYFYA